MAALVSTEYVVGQCRLLSGTQTYLVQVFLGCIALSSLWYKRHVERPKRSFEIWALDVSKQGIGAVMGHCVNLFIAIYLPPFTDECSWYFLNFISDVTLGTVLALAFLRFQQELAVLFKWTAIEESGDYGNPVSYRIWGFQLISWLAIILCAKGIVTSVLIATAGFLGSIGNWLFSPLENHPFAELLVVMVVCPCFLNVLQFWIQDSFLKRGNAASTPYNRYNKTKPGQFDQALQLSLLSRTPSMDV